MPNAQRKQPGRDHRKVRPAGLATHNPPRLGSSTNSTIHGRGATIETPACASWQRTLPPGREPHPHGRRARLVAPAIRGVQVRSIFRRPSPGGFRPAALDLDSSQDRQHGLLPVLGF